MPLILDNILVFLFRTFFRLFWQWYSSDWPVTVAVIHQSIPDTSMYPSVRATYTYAVNGIGFSGQYKRGYWLSESAKDFARHFAKGKRVAIRYNPRKPGQSFLRESFLSQWDQIPADPNS